MAFLVLHIFKQPNFLGVVYIFKQRLILVDTHFVSSLLWVLWPAPELCSFLEVEKSYYGQVCIKHDFIWILQLTLPY